ncbi:MAG: UDP-N-acetylmuramoyl-tripeptide--D-alanyl-D-alanine ligase [Bacteroidota bacterium]|nr:UDP-N-acetylmuramoyl-tripeptide--D-alanyl-D-alanine ligase [Bacteroidota bacterium]
MQIETLYQKYLSSTGVTTDTRNIAAGNIFFALKGDKFNANKFAAEALDTAAFAIVDEIDNADWKNKYGERLILVEDVLKTLQQLAGYHRGQLKCPVLGITGSNGKTTTKELIAAVLSKKYKTYATKGNLNNHIGIPLTLLAIKDDVEFAVIEMGANHVGEIASYCDYVRPDYGLITNVGLAHTEGFGGFEGVVKGKTELYQYLGTYKGKVFLNLDNNILTERASAFGFGVSDINSVIGYGTLPGAWCTARIKENKDFLSVGCVEDGKEVVVRTNLVGEYNFENVVSAICVGKYFGVGIDAIKESIEAYVPSNNRSQKIQYGSNTVILDAYNANPSSMTEALKNFAKITAQNKVVILGEMMELGDYSVTEHKKIAKAVSDMSLTKRIFTGSGFGFLKNDPAFIYFEKTDALKDWFKQQQFENCYILIKGSRKNELEKILKD